MKIKNNYWFTVLNAFHGFIYRRDSLDKLIESLERVQSIERINQNWTKLELLIRFGDSPIQYSINDVRKDLNSSTTTLQNKALLIDHIMEAINSDPSYLVITFNRL